MNDSVYRFLRREFMADADLSDHLPQFVRAAQDTGTMWAFFKELNPQWAPRRQYVREKFTNLIDILERSPTSASGGDAQAAKNTSADQKESPMYNLLVSGDKEAWNGQHWTVEASRCVNEYTDEAIISKHGALDATAIEALQKLPCIFAYESGREKNPKFGVVRDVVKRQGLVRVEYDLIPVDPFLSHKDIEDMSFELDIRKWEMNRTHWAVKDVNLAKELRARGISLPNWTRTASKSVDISTHQFEVALSFPGEIRPMVEDVAGHLERFLGPNAYFYDNNYVSQLARPSLDTFLQDIYRNRSKLIVVFLSSDYQRKTWCGIEFRAIRDIIAGRANDRIMFIRTDDGAVEGVFATDGYIDARRHDSSALARFIQERVQMLKPI